MSWEAIEVTRGMSLDGEEAKIMNACQWPWMAAGAPVEACLLASQESFDPPVNRFLFFSPRMVDICSTIITRYDPQPCPEPDFKTVSILLANGVPSRTFAKPAGE